MLDVELAAVHTASVAVLMALRKVSEPAMELVVAQVAPLHVDVTVVLGDDLTVALAAELDAALAVAVPVTSLFRPRLCPFQRNMRCPALLYNNVG